MLCSFGIGELMLMALQYFVTTNQPVLKLQVADHFIERYLPTIIDNGKGSI